MKASACNGGGGGSGGSVVLSWLSEQGIEKFESHLQSPASCLIASTPRFSHIPRKSHLRVVCESLASNMFLHFKIT